jgi:lipid-A-disaccharide synthase
VTRPLRVALVAGEASGDLLGAAFMTALRQLHPDVSFTGVAGPRMIAAGCTPLAHSEELALMGVVEIVRHLPRLLRLRRRIRSELLAQRPDVYIGIDAPEFNLGLARQLHQAGIVTVQYVSPQVWAWRQGRVRSIAEAVDLVLCLLPFEKPFYARHAVRAEFVGHPLADQIPLHSDRDAARAALGLPRDATVIALLPGSRLGEVSRLGADFAATAALLSSHAAKGQTPLFIAPMATPKVREIFAAQVAAAGAQVQLLDGQSRLALAAADAVLVASGTATLETLLMRRPMVVAYRLAPLTAFLAQRLGLVKVQHFSQPNLLAGQALVPEFFQSAVTPPALAEALSAQLTDTAARAHREAAFESIHLQLRQDGASKAAAAVLTLLRDRGLTA